MNLLKNESDFFLGKIKTIVETVIWDIYRFCRSPMHHGAIWLDCLRTRVKTKFIRKNKDAACQGDKVVLVASMTEFVFQLKLEALFAAALKMAGWQVHVLTTNSRNIWARRYFALHGINQFIYWDDLQLSDSELEVCSKESARLLKTENLDFQKVKSWMFEDSWIGPQILSSIARETHKGAPDLNDPKVLTRMRMLLPQTLERVSKAKLLISKVQPNFMFGIEANYSLMGAIVDQSIAAGVDFAQVVQPSRDDAVIIRRLNQENRRMHPNTLSKQSFAWICENIEWSDKLDLQLLNEFKDRYGGRWFLQSRNQINTIEKTKLEIQKQLSLDPQKLTVAVFSHVLWDANLFYGEDIFLDYEDWFVQTLRAACNNQNVNWIIKLHPANAWKRARDRVKGELAEEVLIRKHIGALPSHVKLLMPDTDISTKSLFELVDYGVTVRGTAGMELPCFGKLTFTAGTGRYSGFGFTNDSNTVQEYLQKMSNIQNMPPLDESTILLAKKFAYGVFKLRPFILKSCKCNFKYKKQGHHPLDHNISVTVNSLKEMEKNADFHKFLEWVNDRGAVDYMETPAFSKH